MAVSDNLLSYTSLIQFTSNGLAIAEYYQIKEAIQTRYREIYGEDIDLATTSADGVFVESICLLINNILQSFKTFYNQLDVSTASGIYLDRLCALMNITRKSATKSTAIVSLTLDTTATEDYSTNLIVLADKNGNTWRATGTDDNPIILQPGIEQDIIFTCDSYGPIQASQGYIDRLVNNNVVIAINQKSNANPGSYGETDAQLKARRNQSLSPAGTTVMESMAGALLSLTGIDDVKIYNNDTTQQITSKDGTNIPIHSVYVVIRQKQNVSIADSTIGTIIYEKMTPGIPTIESSGIYGAKHSYDYKQYILGEIVNEDMTQNVYWKSASSVNPKIVITIAPNNYYASANNATAMNIANQVINLMNNKLLSEDTNVEELKETVKYSDPLFRGQKTYKVESITINSSDEYVNQDTFYYYFLQNVQVNDETNKITITIQ